MTKKHSNTNHPFEYYESILRILIDAAADSKTYPQMAVLLNAKTILTPTGLIWSGERIKQVFKKLRGYKTYGSKIHRALLALIFEGQFTLEESLPLFKSRLHATL